MVKHSKKTKIIKDNDRVQDYFFSLSILQWGNGENKGKHCHLKAGKHCHLKAGLAIIHVHTNSWTSAFHWTTNHEKRLHKHHIHRHLQNQGLNMDRQA